MLRRMSETPLDAAAIAAVDPTDQIGDVLSIGDHLRDAMWKAESAGLGRWESPGGLVVAGMGGSAHGGILARAALADQAGRPLLAARGYELPPWTTDDTTVLCASYSGDTEETLACFEAAGVIGAPRVVVTSGGELARLAREEGVPVIPVAGGLVLSGEPSAALHAVAMRDLASQISGLVLAKPKSTTFTPRLIAPCEKASARPSPVRRMSRATNTVDALVNSANPTPSAYATSSFI